MKKIKENNIEISPDAVIILPVVTAEKPSK